ncbi:MAG TPA: hypothetical protein VHK69_17090 [Chitinophagaceae bacterium]|jgi:hypothetical protein|nr:hypothetical protein [Chitinophagaceae bacterium]
MAPYTKILLFLSVVAAVLTACSSSRPGGREVTRTAAYPRVLARALKDHRYVLMRSGVDTFHVTSMLIDRQGRQFTVHLAKLDSAHRVHFNNFGSLPEKQVRLYMRDSASYTLDEPHTLPLARVARIELVE